MRFDSFSQMLAHWAKQTPDAPALIFDEGERKTLSFSGLNLAVHERAKALQAGGKTCLGVLSDGSAACVIEIFSAVQAGL